MRYALLMLAACSKDADPTGVVAMADRHATVTWTAKVAASEGRAVKPGDPCELTATHRSNGVSAVEVNLRITCGKAVIYAEPTFGAGMPGRLCRAYEEPADDLGSYRYALDCTDAGATRLKLDTHLGTAVIDGTGSSPFHVALEVEPKSSIYRGEPLYAGNAPRDPGFDAPLQLPGKLVEVIGLGADMKDTACTLRITPRTGRFNCHIFVACNGKTLYGGDGSGFTDCTIEHRRPMRAHDPKGIAEEGDPKLEMNLGNNEVIVSNDDPGATYRARIVVEKPAEQP